MGGVDEGPPADDDEESPAPNSDKSSPPKLASNTPPRLGKLLLLLLLEATFVLLAVALGFVPGRDRRIPAVELACNPSAGDAKPLLLALVKPAARWRLVMVVLCFSDLMCEERLGCWQIRATERPNLIRLYSPVRPVSQFKRKAELLRSVTSLVSVCAVSST